MNYDLAIVYFGMTRSLKKVFETHQTHIFNVLKQNNISYQTFMHTWTTEGNKQRVFNDHVSVLIDEDDHKIINPDFYQIHNQNRFEESINIKDYFYAQLFHDKGDCDDGEWFPLLILNHLCSLESQKRGLEMVEKRVQEGNSYKFIMYVRPDVSISNPLPIIQAIVNNPDKISIPDEYHYEGYNDRFAIIPYKLAHIYGKRIDNLLEYRRTQGRIVSERYIKYVLETNKIEVNLLDFHFEIVRPS